MQVTLKKAKIKAAIVLPIVAILDNQKKLKVATRTNDSKRLNLPSLIPEERKKVNSKSQAGSSCLPEFMSKDRWHLFLGLRDCLILYPADN
jgi:hypothetical protein